MTTHLPPDSPRAYARAQLGENTRRYMIEKRWIDRRTIVRMERAAAAYRIAIGAVMAAKGVVEK